MATEGCLIKGVRLSSCSLLTAALVVDLVQGYGWLLDQASNLLEGTLVRRIQVPFCLGFGQGMDFG